MNKKLQHSVVYVSVSSPGFLRPQYIKNRRIFMGDEVQESKAFPPSTCMSFSIFQVYWDDIVMTSAFRFWINRRSSLWAIFSGVKSFIP
jgi:hypothetical protein